MNKTAYDISKIYKISVITELPNPWYKWKSEIRIFGMRLRKEGVYSDGIRNNVWQKEVPDHSYISDGQVLFVPHVEMKFISGTGIIKWFDNVEKAIAFAEEMGVKTGCTWESPK